MDYTSWESLTYPKVPSCSEYQNSRWQQWIYTWGVIWILAFALACWAVPSCISVKCTFLIILRIPCFQGLWVLGGRVEGAGSAWEQCLCTIIFLGFVWPWLFGSQQECWVGSTTATQLWRKNLKYRSSKGNCYLPVLVWLHWWWVWDSDVDRRQSRVHCTSCKIYKICPFKSEISQSHPSETSHTNRNTENSNLSSLILSDWGVMLSRLYNTCTVFMTSTHKSHQSWNIDLCTEISQTDLLCSGNT
jgi:hypothetical protein